MGGYRLKKFKSSSLVKSFIQEIQNKYDKSEITNNESEPNKTAENNFIYAIDLN